MYDLAIKNGTVYENSEFREANVYVKDGLIAEISSGDHEAKETVEAARKKVIPGIIDPHVHFELNIGKYTSADDFGSGSRAGLYGGVTSFIDFLDPVNRGSLVDEAFQRRLALARKSSSDFSFHVTAANPVNETENITNEAVRLKIPSIKVFTAYSESNRRTYEKEIGEFLALSEQRGTTLLVHAEDEDFMESDPDFLVKDLARSRPEKSAVSMIKKLAVLSEEKGGKLYVVHTNCGESVRFMTQNHGAILNKNMFLESCPHYFYLTSDRFKEKEGYKYILAPPLRSQGQSDLLKEQKDSLFSIGTDHCPFMSSEKQGDYLNQIPFGIGGIEYSFPLMYSLFGESIIDKMTRNPAKLFGLSQKGLIVEGRDGDFCLFDEKEEVIQDNHSQCDYNVYQGFSLKCVVERTIIRGKTVMNRGKLFPREGQFIARGV